MKRKNWTKKRSIHIPLISVIVSLFLVAAAIGIVFAFKMYLNNHTYNGTEIDAGLESTEDVEKEKQYLQTDEKFEPCYVMIYDVPESGVWANRVPGKRADDSKELFNGQIVRAKERGTYDGKNYYLLGDDLYLSASIAHAEPLVSYVEVEGYLAITYVSSTGVHLRSWADFDADNVMESVYVGDKVQVKAKVETEKGASAYITIDDLYITADTRYLNDYSSVPEEKTRNTQKGQELNKKSEEKDFLQENTEAKGLRNKNTK